MYTDMWCVCVCVVRGDTCLLRRVAFPMKFFSSLSAFLLSVYVPYRP